MAASKVENKKVRKWDRLGVFVSSLCVVHCLLLPLLMVAFPSLTWLLPLEDEHTHQLLFLFLAPAAGFAMYSGFRIHKQRRPLVYMAIGLLLIVLGTFHGLHLIPHEMEPLLVLVGSIIMVRAHFLNSHHCNRCEEEDKCIWDHDHSHDHAPHS